MSNHIYLRNLLSDLWKKKFVVLIVMLAAMVAVGVLGFFNSKKPSSLSQKEQEEVDLYEERLADYDEQIKQLETDLAAQKEEIEGYRTYIDESIYMKLDPDNHAIASVSFTVQNAERADLVIPALLEYFNTGAIFEDIAVLAGDSYSIYWKEMSWCGSNNIIFNCLTRNCTEEDATAVMDYICTAITNKAPEFIGLYGNFELIPDRSCYLTPDAGIASEQFNKQSTMMSYDNNYADLTNRLTSTKEGKNTYIEEHTPASIAATSENVALATAVYALVGLIAGLLLSILFFLFRYILGDRIHNSRDMADYDLLHLLDAKEVEFLSKKKDHKSLCLVTLSETEIAGTTTAALREGLEGLCKEEFSYECDSCVLVLEAGVSTYHKLDETLAKMDKCAVEVLGYVMVE